MDAGVELRDNSLRRTGRIKQGLFVGDPNDGVAPPPEPRFAFSVTQFYIIMIMNAAIDFDNQACAMADKIDDIGSKRRLPSEMQAGSPQR